MKDIITKINESSKDKYGNEILTREEITLDVLKNACHGSSFMDDRATLYIDNNGCWNKIGKDKWQYSSNQEHVIGHSCSSKELWDKYVEQSKEAKMYLK